MFINLDWPEVIYNTRLWEDDFPKEGLYMPVNMHGHMTSTELLAASDEWLQNIESCSVQPVFKNWGDVDSDIIQVDYWVGKDDVGNAVVFPTYPECPEDADFVGWRIYIRYCHGWTSSDSDDDLTQLEQAESDMTDTISVTEREIRNGSLQCNALKFKVLGHATSPQHDC